MVYHRIRDRWDRWILGNLGKLQGLWPSRFRNYHFRSYFHRGYVRRAAAFLAEREVDAVVFPLYPQWGPVIREILPKARRILWMQCEWASAGPAACGRFLEDADRIVCCSRFIADRIGEVHPATAERLRVVPNGVDTRLFTPFPDRSRHRIVYAGRLTPEKGAHVLLEAFLRVRSRYPDAQLVLAGPFWITPPDQLVGSDPKAIRSWRRLGRRYPTLFRKKADSNEGVFLTDHIPHKALVGMYRTASVFVHPALWNEPFGMILAEAMACGLPVVASRTGGIPEVIQDGRSGLLVDPGDADALVNAIERLFENRDLAARLGQAARHRAEEHFDWSVVAGRMADIVLD